MNEILKPGVALFAICVVAAASLGFTYSATKGPIEARQAQTKADSMRELIPSAKEFHEDVTIPEGSAVTSAASGYAGGTPAGWVIGVSPKGYSGAIDMLVGILPDGKVSGVTIVSHSETPGLGAKARDANFTAQYIGQTGPFLVTKSSPVGDNEIQAITSATITTNAVTLGVNQALEFYNNELAGGEGAK